MTAIILAIETATDACSVALSTPQQTFIEYAVVPQAHSKLLLGMIHCVCTAAGISLSDVTAFAYGKGPGSFTGLRIAASVVQGLAFGISKPVLAVSSLQALAQQVLNAPQYILPMLDARMQEVYWGMYKSNEQGVVELVSADRLQKPADLILTHSNNYIAVGTGCSAYADILLQQNPQLTINCDILYPRAQEVVQLAAAQLLGSSAGIILTPQQAVPAYIRNNVVQTGKKNPD